MTLHVPLLGQAAHAAKMYTVLINEKLSYQKESFKLNEICFTHQLSY